MNRNSDWSLHPAFEVVSRARHKFRICPRCSKWHWSKVYECKRCGLWYNDNECSFECGGMLITVFGNYQTVIVHKDWESTLNFPVSPKITEEELCKYLILE